MALPPFDPTNPIPNNPFYFPSTASITGPDGPLIVGSGLAISPDGVISATGTTTTGVSSLNAGPGIFVTANTGDIVVNNTGVLDIQPGLGISVSANTGVITISADNNGTVTSVGVGYGLGIFGSVGPITTSGIIELVDTGVVPGVYTAPQIQIDEKGRIISATSDSYVASVTANSPLNATAGTNPVISVNAATTTQPGVVQLSDSVTSGSSTTAATSAAVQIAYIKAGEGISKTLLTGKGALISASAVNSPVTVAVGADGQILMADSTDPRGIKWADNDEGTVTLINTGTGLTGGPIDVTGTISLADTAVTPGNYTYASFSVDAQGRLYAASSGVDPVTSVTGTAPIQVSAGTTPIVSIDPATTLAPGAVQLYNGTDSTSTALALTAAQGKALQDQIDALAVANNLTLAGTLDASTGLLLTVTVEGSAVGFAVGQPLPLPSVANAEYFVIVRIAGNYTPPGGTAVAASQGDWFLSIGTAWQFLDVGYIATYATTTEPGLVTLATDAEVQAGTDATKAVVPSALQSKLSDSTSTTSSTTIASSTAVKTAWDLADAAVPKATFTAKGDTLVGTGSGTFSALNSSLVQGQVLTVDSAAPTGLAWATPSGGTVTSITAGTGLDGGTITTSGTINLANTTVTPGVYNYAGIIVDQQGRITAATNGAAPLPLTGGTMTGDITFQNLGDGLYFQGTAALLGITDLVNVVDSEIAASATAVKTAYDLAAATAAGAIPSTAFTSKGELLAGTGNGTYTQLLGTGSGIADGKVLSTDSNASTGLAWIDPPIIGIQSLTSTTPALLIGNNPDAQNLSITAVPGTTTQLGVVQLNDNVFSTSTTTAATARATNLAYQTAVDAALNATQGGLSGIRMAYVSPNGNNATAAYGTTLAYTSIQAAINDQGTTYGRTIFIAPGVYQEDLNIINYCHLVGLNCEGQLDEGVTIIGEHTIQYSGAGNGGDTTFTNIKFYSPQILGPSAVVSFGGSSQFDGEITFNECYFQRTYSPDITQQWAFRGTGNWSVPCNFNNCTFSGSIYMGAGNTDGSSATLVLRNCGGFSTDDYILIESGTVKVLDTPEFLCPILQTGGVLEVSGVGSGILSSSSNLNSAFGGLGYSYLGSAASVGNGAVEFSGSVPAQGLVDIGFDVQYSLDGLTMSLANLTNISINPIYTPGVSDRSILQSSYLQSEQLKTMNATLSGSPADQRAIVTNPDGTINWVSEFDAGSY